MAHADGWMNGEGPRPGGCTTARLAVAQAGAPRRSRGRVEPLRPTPAPASGRCRRRRRSAPGGVGDDDGKWARVTRRAREPSRAWVRSGRSSSDRRCQTAAPELFSGALETNAAVCGSARQRLPRRAGGTGSPCLAERVRTARRSPAGGSHDQPGHGPLDTRRRLGHAPSRSRWVALRTSQLAPRCLLDCVRSAGQRTARPACLTRDDPGWSSAQAGRSAGVPINIRTRIHPGPR